MLSTGENQSGLDIGSRCEWRVAVVERGLLIGQEQGFVLSAVEALRVFGLGCGQSSRLLEQIKRGGRHGARGELHPFLADRRSTGGDRLPRMSRRAGDVAGCREARRRDDPRDIADIGGTFAHFVAGVKDLANRVDRLRFGQ